MSEQQNSGVTLLEKPQKTGNGRNGKNNLTADSIYFRVKMPENIVKRDGRIVPFKMELIEKALLKCYASLPTEPKTGASEIARRVVNVVAAKYDLPTVEGVQDIVEMVLQAAGEYEAAKHYILYRAEHAKMRVQRPIPEAVREAFAASDKYFPTQLQKFQFYDKYSRFNYEVGRRETWIETVDRAVDYLRELSEGRLETAVYDRLRQGILDMKAMPSMRLLAMAGPAARRNNIALYNCSYMPVNSLDSFVEALIISMSGCGVGFSVERRYVEQFPRITRQKGGPVPTFVVPDSSEGWAEAVRTGLTAWFNGEDVAFDYSEVRPAGAPLQIKGGRASGPEPLRKMLDFARSRILARQGGFLRPLDAHDIMCSVGDAAVSGGVRRCLPAGTRIHTDRGSIPIEEVTTQDQVMTAFGYKPVTGWLDQGVQDIVELVTESGTIFKCTPDHRIAVLADVWGNYHFKQAQHLTPDDRILFITHAIDGQQTELKPLPDKRQADHSGSVLPQPMLTTETAWFLGKFFADGYVQVTDHINGKGGNTAFSVACHENEKLQIERINHWAQSHNLNLNDHSADDEHCVKLRSGNRQIARWMYLYKQPNVTLHIPEEIWRAPQAIRAAFIAGVMDGDGSYIDRPVIVVSTVYEEFARDLAKLLATLGIISEVKLRRPATEKGWQAIWTVSLKDATALTKAEHILGPLSSQPWVSRHGKQAGYTIPGEFVKRDLPRNMWKNKWPASRDPNMNSATLTEMVEATHYVPVQVVEIRQGGKAHTYDLEVKEGSTFVAEGYLVHNTAMISLFDYDDLEMRHCKDGDFWHSNSQRWNANNSAVWPERELTQTEVTRFVLDMVESGRGEPGIFNRRAAVDNRPTRRAAAEFGTNPCGEIILLGRQFCNLTSAIARAEDDYESLKDKVEIATIIGTIQSMATHFPGLREEWRQNCMQERLLGVDLNGQMDSPVAQDAEVQKRLQEVAVETNRHYAHLLGINQSAAVTCVKPSGNSSQLLNSSSGLHARWSPYYVRNVRVGTHTPVFKVLRDAGVPMDPENGQTREAATTWVVHFPVKAPETAVTRNQRTALEQCDFWLQNKINYTEHNPSVTITYQPHEVLDIIRWVWEHQDKIGGMAFLPAFDAQYDQMPYVDIGRKAYERLAAQFPEIDFSKIYRYEEEDLTTAAQELACLAGSCDI